MIEVDVEADDYVTFLMNNEGAIRYRTFMRHEELAKTPDMVLCILFYREDSPRDFVSPLDGPQWEASMTVNVD